MREYGRLNSPRSNVLEEREKILLFQFLLSIFFLLQPFLNKDDVIGALMDSPSFYSNSSPSAPKYDYKWPRCKENESLSNECQP